MTNRIIDEVRAIREQHAASFGYDLDRIFADIQQREKKYASEGWVIIPEPTGAPPESTLSLQRTRFGRR